VNNVDVCRALSALLTAASTVCLDVRGTVVKHGDSVELAGMRSMIEEQLYANLFFSKGE